MKTILAIFGSFGIVLVTVYFLVSNGIIGAPVATFVTLCWLIGVAAYIMHRYDIFKYDTRNPYRRYCKKCGQQQDRYGYAGHSGGWWEDMLPVHDENCSCHNHTGYLPV